MALMGPLTFIQGGYGIRAQLPIFVHNTSANATFGAPDPLGPLCGSLCYNETTRSKFWGFVSLRNAFGQGSTRPGGVRGSCPGVGVFGCVFGGVAAWRGLLAAAHARVRMSGCISRDLSLTLWVVGRLLRGTRCWRRQAMAGAECSAVQPLAVRSGTPHVPRRG